MTMKTSPWDPVDRLSTVAARKAYLEAALELGDPVLVAAAKTDIARAIMKAELSAHRDLT
jgi:DNA-binding phage protein